MPALLEAVADLEVEELKIVPSNAPAGDPKRVLETVMIGPHSREVPSTVLEPAIVASSCACCQGCIHNGCFY